MAVIDAFSAEKLSAEKCHYTSCIAVFSALKESIFSLGNHSFQYNLQFYFGSLSQKT
jgi:hypothetical protein